MYEFKGTRTRENASTRIDDPSRGPEVGPKAGFGIERAHGRGDGRVRVERARNKVKRRRRVEESTVRLGRERAGEMVGAVSPVRQILGAGVGANLSGLTRCDRARAGCAV